MKLNDYIKKMEEAFDVAIKVARKENKYIGYINGYLDGALNGIRSIAIEDREITPMDYDDIISYSHELQRRFDEDESKSI